MHASCFAHAVLTAITPKNTLIRIDKSFGYILQCILSNLSYNRYLYSTLQSNEKNQLLILGTVYLSGLFLQSFADSFGKAELMPDSDFA
ncbi:MAG: hypothetical protein ACJAU1_000763 [Psychromonas sp.]